VWHTIIIQRSTHNIYASSFNILQEFQSDVERLQIEMKRKSAELDVAANEKERMLGKLKATEGCLKLLL